MNGIILNDLNLSIFEEILIKISHILINYHKRIDLFYIM